MKIGILTLPIVDNYGGILQAVALYRWLENQGHDVDLIYKDRYHKQALWKRMAIWSLLKIPFHNIKNVKTNDRLKKLRLELKRFHRPFIEKEIQSISPPLYTKSQLESYVAQMDFDAVVVGSDQVWRKQYINDVYYKSYFLDFVESKKINKIAYAASFGKDCWEGEGDHKQISQLLKNFSAISTREVSGVKVCNETFGYDEAKHVLDPTLLHTKQFYLDEIVSKNDTSTIPASGLVTYVLDEAAEKKQIIDYVKSNGRLSDVFHIKGFNQSDVIYTVPQWVAALANADFIVTDSFHGMVFALIFEKNFVVIANQDRGLDRFVSLLNLLNLTERLVKDVDDLKSVDLSLPNYEQVNQIIASKRVESIDFLTNAINMDK